VYRIARKFHIKLLETRPPHLKNVTTLPCEKQLIWCCLPDSRHYTHHIDRLLSEPPTYCFGKLL